MKENDVRMLSQLIPFLSLALGPDYEIVLSDLHSVLALSDNRLSGLTVGSPLPDPALRILSAQEQCDQNWRLNDRIAAQNGHLLRCSTCLIRDAKGALSGFLSIYFDDSRYKDLSDRVFALCHADSYVAENIQIRMIPETPHENFQCDIDLLAADAFRKATGETLAHSNRASYEEKLNIIRSLYRNGVFSIKGAIPELAKRLSCSQASMYRYLAIVKAEDPESEESD